MSRSPETFAPGSRSAVSSNCPDAGGRRCGDRISVRWRPSSEARATGRSPPDGSTRLEGHPIGGGAPLSDDPTLALLRKWADELRERTEVVFLGDNVYPAGVQPSNPNAGDVLLQQLRATRAAKLFVPGNHEDLGVTIARPLLTTSRGSARSAT